MAISNFPTALQGLIQQNFLERMFSEGLRSKLGYRQVADQEPFQTGIGETLTKTKYGHKAPVPTPLNPSLNTNLDNGLTPASNRIEQYTMTLNEYGDTIDLNIISQKVGIEKQFLMNARVNGVQAEQTLDRIAQYNLFNAYLGGNTRVTTTLGAPAATISVDDIRGFQYVYVNGAYVAVSGTNTMTVTVGSNAYTLTGATADGTNTSTAPRGISGTLTFSANVSVADGTAGNAVVSSVSPTILRPSARATTAALTSGDKLTMELVMDAVTRLRNNGIPARNGLYDCILDHTAMRQLFADSEFQLLFRGTGISSEEYRKMQVIELLDVRFIRTNEAPQQSLSTGVKVHRPIICGESCLIEGYFEGLTDEAQRAGPSIVSVIDNVAQVTRAPLDRLQQIIAQSWYAIMGYAVPSDITADPTIIPTANNSYFKRAVVLEVGDIN